MQKRYYCIIIFFVLSIGSICFMAWDFAENYEPPKLKPKPIPQPLKTWYEYTGTIYEIFRRSRLKYRHFGALTTDATAIQFYKEAYVTLKVGDFIKIYNWEGNWQSKRKMEIYRNGTFLGEFWVWFT